VALAAGLKGNGADARKYADLAASIKQAFNAKFYHPDTGLYGNGSQTSLSCALYQGLVEPANKARVLSNLVAAVEKTNDHIDTGILGAKYLLNALLENGRADVACRIASQKDLPSWGWWLEQGATTLWENWNGAESRNHIMYGDISAWFYKALAGINLDPAAPAFKHFIIKPNLVGGLTSAKASYDSARGRIVSDWKTRDGRLELTVAIPANTSATVSVPVADAAAIKEDGKPAANAVGIRLLRVESGRTLFEVGSGTYHFTAPR
jgi:alpha-L-rhamnosidase